MQAEAQLNEEARVFTRYLVSEEADELTLQLYIKAHTNIKMNLTEKESKRLTFLLKHPGCIDMVDGALAIIASESGIRKKLYVLFAILESNPRYAKYFLPDNKTDLFSIIGSGIVAVWNAAIGLIILPWI